MLYLLSIGIAQHITAHNMNEIGLRIQQTHKPSQFLPEPAHTEINPELGNMI